MNFNKARLVNEEELSRLVEKQIREYNPNLHIFGQIQLQQESILNNPKLSSDDKLLLFKKLQQRFSNMKHVSFSGPSSNPKKNLNELKRKASFEDIFDEHTAKSVEGDPDEEVASDQDTTLEKHSLQEMSESKDEEDDEKSFPAEAEFEIKDLPRKYITKFNRLKELLHDNQGKISFKASTGEAVLNGRVINGSNLTDLIKNLYQYSENRNLVGTGQFTKTLREIFQKQKDLYPGQYVSNKDFLAQVRHPLSSSSSTSQIGTGKKNLSLSTPGKSVKVLYLYPR